MPEQTHEQHEHQRIEVRTDCPDCGQELARQTFNRADLEQQQLNELVRATASFRKAETKGGLVRRGSGQ